MARKRNSKMVVIDIEPIYYLNFVNRRGVPMQWNNGIGYKSDDPSKDPDLAKAIERLASKGITEYEVVSKAEHMRRYREEAHKRLEARKRGETV